jgi:DNA-binding transcriptional LysR family regulator
MDSFAGMESFARVVETGSFTAAAARLQTAKSSVSDSVRALEERLGVRLLERTTRRVRPTEAGRLLYARCQRLLDEAAVARAEARALRSAPAGSVRVAVPESFGERYILPGLGGFLARFPSVRVELVSGARHTRLVEEEFDLAIRIAETLEPTLVVRRIGVSKIVIVAAPSYLAAHGAPAEPKDIARHACVGMAPPLPWHAEWRVGGVGVVVSANLVVNSGESLRAAAIAGLGLTPAPDWLVADALATGQLVRVLTDFDTLSSGIYAVYPTNRLLTPIIREFVDHVAGDLRRRGVAA